MSYYMAVGSEQRGPFPKEQLSGQGIKPDTMVWTDGMAQWQRADSVAELAGLFTAAAPVVAYAQPPGAIQSGVPYAPIAHSDPRNIASTKMAAGLCAILIGGFGVHKFILGMTSAGVILIVITILTCGIGHIIGIIEGIIYLTKSDEEFYQTYMVQKKAWF